MLQKSCSSSMQLFQPFSIYSLIFNKNASNIDVVWLQLFFIPNHLCGPMNYFNHYRLFKKLLLLLLLAIVKMLHTELFV